MPTRPVCARLSPGRPCIPALWRWLDKAVRQEAVCREGSGLKHDPYRSWLAGQEERWQADPLVQREQTLAAAREEVSKLSLFDPPE